MASSSSEPVQMVLSRLESVKSSGHGWMARCPAHVDNKASLSISEGDDGKALLHCHAGCKVEHIVNLLGLTMSDLYPAESGRRSVAATSSGRIAAIYQYKDQDGVVLFESVRIQTETSKTFRQRQPGPDGKGSVWDLKGVRLVPYHLPELIAAVSKGKTVCIAEGEKDVETLRSWGLAATCNPMGAGKWEKIAAVAANVLRGAKVVVIPDDDEPGRKHAQEVAESLQSVAAEVKVLPTFPGSKDVTAWKESGGTREQLEKIVRKTPSLEKASSGVASGAANPLKPIGTRLSELPPNRPMEWLWYRRFPAGKVSIVEGNGETGKGSLLIKITALLTTGNELPFDDTPRTPRTVLWLSTEDAGDTLLARLTAAGGNPSRVVDLTEGGNRSIELPRDTAVLEAAIRQENANMLVIDPFLAVLGGKVDANNDQSVRTALTPLVAIAERTGCAIILIRHWGKAIGRSAAHKGIGSVGIINAARATWAVMPDPADPDVRLMLRVKTNLTHKPPGLAFRLDGKDGLPTCTFLREDSRSADDVLDGSIGKSGATAFLRNLLANGAVDSNEVQSRAAAAGYSRNQILHAKDELGVKPKKNGFTGGWTWGIE